MRIAEISLGEEFTNATVNNKKEVWAAVGYLATWACGSERYAKVSIYGEDRGDLMATYRDKDGNHTYTIAGIRDSHNGTYSFHS